MPTLVPTATFSLTLLPPASLSVIAETFASLAVGAGSTLTLGTEVLVVVVSVSVEPRLSSVSIAARLLLAKGAGAVDADC